MLFTPAFHKPIQTPIEALYQGRAQKSSKKLYIHRVKNLQNNYSEQGTTLLSLSNLTLIILKVVIG